MISSTGHVELAFQEPDLTSISPQSAPFVACALAHGWRFMRDGYYNLADTYIGPKHVQDFKRAKRKDMHRVITYRFAAVEREVFGEKLTLRGFLKRCQDDARYFLHARSHPKYARKLDLLLAHFAKRELHFEVQDSAAHDRRLIVPSHGGPLDLIHKLAEEYEVGMS